MPSPLVTQHGSVAVLPSSFCADVAYYAALASHPVAVIDSSVRFDKRAKHTHRTTIASTHGPLTLTVPIQNLTLPTVLCGIRFSCLPTANGGTYIPPRWKVPTDALLSLSITPTVFSLSWVRMLSIAPLPISMPRLTASSVPFSASIPQ